jgi:D-alanine--poly(phosphoribitol) ligase subunit 2
MMDTRTKVLEIIRQVSRQNADPQPDESLFESGLLDSFALPDMVSALETAFAIKIPDSDLNPRKFDSIERIETYLENHK